MNPEQIRIRALVVARLNYFRRAKEEDEAHGDMDSARKWKLVELSMRGLLEEIDEGMTVSQMRGADAG